jgi:hypothetical protein
MDAAALKRLREDLNLVADEDYLVLLSIAERLSPGVYFRVEGNPDLLPGLILEVFQSF